MIHSSSKFWTKSVRLAAEEVDSKFDRKDWTSTYAYHGENSPTGAYAVDFMISDKKTGKAIADYVWSNRKRLGVWYVIWDGRIISRTKGKGYWRTYTPTAQAIRNNPDSAYHRNHVHVSFYTDATYSEPAKSVTMYTTKDGVKGYKLNPVRVTQVRQKGFKLVGTIVTLSDGKYLKTRFGTHYPYDSISKVNPLAK